MNDNRGKMTIFMTRVLFDSHLSEYYAYPTSILPQTSELRITYFHSLSPSRSSSPPPAATSSSRSRSCIALPSRL